MNTYIDSINKFHLDWDEKINKIGKLNDDPKEMIRFELLSTLLNRRDDILCYSNVDKEFYKAISFIEKNEETLIDEKIEKMKKDGRMVEIEYKDVLPIMLIEKDKFKKTKLDIFPIDIFIEEKLGIRFNIIKGLKESKKMWIFKKIKESILLL